MAKYKCPFCDYFVHTSGAIPNPKEWLMLSAKDWDKLPESIDSAELYQKATPFFKCIHCEAVAIFWSGHGENPTWYSRHEE